MLVTIKHIPHLLTNNTECRATGAALGKSCLVALEEKGRRGAPGKEIFWKAIQSVLVL